MAGTDSQVNYLPQVQGRIPGKQALRTKAQAKKQPGPPRWQIPDRNSRPRRSDPCPRRHYPARQLRLGARAGQ